MHILDELILGTALWFSTLDIKKPREQKKKGERKAEERAGLLSLCPMRVHSLMRQRKAALFSSPFSVKCVCVCACACVFVLRVV